MAVLTTDKDGRSQMCASLDDNLPAQEEERGGIEFTPRLYIQRYEAVTDILLQFNNLNLLKTVVDFGCAEGNLLRRLRYELDQVDNLVGIDIDTDVLQIAGERLKHIPNREYFLDRRSKALKVKLIRGSIAETEKLRGHVDAVTCVELIEHLYDDELRRVPESIFGRLVPRVAIVTTPNSEFNCLFEFENGKTMRHDDHKFEWTRAQFVDWCKRTCKQYPRYRFHLSGVGEPPESHAHVGHCSQIAVFLLDQAFEPIYSKENTARSELLWLQRHGDTIDYDEDTRESSGSSSQSLESVSSGDSSHTDTANNNNNNVSNVNVTTQTNCARSRNYKTVMRLTYPFDQYGDRRSRVRSHATAFCSKLTADTNKAAELETVEGAFLIPIKVIYESLPTELLELLASEFELFCILILPRHSIFVSYERPWTGGFNQPQPEQSEPLILFPSYDAPIYCGPGRNKNRNENDNNCNGIDDYDEDSMPDFND